MVSRRSFIRVSSLGAAVATAGVGEAFAQPAPGAAPSLPPSIAALTSMKAQARPITAAERSRRIEKAKRLMAAQKIDALMLTGGTSLVYFTNIRWGLSERLLSVVIPVKGTPFLVCPAFEEDRAREQLAGGPLADTDVRTWDEHESPYERIAQALRDRGIASGRVGVEETVRHVFSDGVAQAAPTLSLTSGTPVSAGCRR